MIIKKNDEPYTHKHIYNLQICERYNLFLFLPIYFVTTNH